MPFAPSKPVLPVLPKLKNDLSETSDTGTLCAIEDKELRKKLRNRQSALAARERKKARMLELERQVGSLQQSKKRLEEENQYLRDQVSQFSRSSRQSEVPSLSKIDLTSSQPQAFVQLMHNPTNNTSSYPISRYSENDRFCFQTTKSLYPQNHFNTHLLNNLQNSCQFQRHCDRGISSGSNQNFEDKNKFGCFTGNNVSRTNLYSHLPFVDNKSNFKKSNLSSVKLEQDFSCNLSQIVLSDPISPPKHLTRKQGANSDFNPSSFSKQIKYSDRHFDSNSSELLPSIGSMLDPSNKNAQIETKCSSYSNLHCTNQFPLENNQQIISKHQNIGYNFRKSRSYHSFDGLSYTPNKNYINSSTGITPMFKNSEVTMTPNINTGNQHQVFSGVPSPKSESSFGNKFSDIVFSEPDFDGLSDIMKDFSCPVSREETNEITSSRSDSGISADEHFDWANESQKFLL